MKHISPGGFGIGSTSGTDGTEAGVELGGVIKLEGLAGPVGPGATEAMLEAGGGEMSVFCMRNTQTVTFLI